MFVAQDIRAGAGAAPMTTVTITEAPLAIEDLLAVVGGARVELDGGTRARIAASRAVVDRALADGEAVYGLTTQVGHGKDTRLTEEQIQGEQRFLVMSHSGGIGPPLPTEVVRAALAVRLNGIARGGSGAGVAAAEILAAMLNAGVHPVVPETASVGAADILQMAGMAQVAIGMGRAEYRAEALPGGEALRRAGIAPLVLGGKDGLALISANGVAVGQAALVTSRATAAAEAADIAAALSMEATGANTSVLRPVVRQAKPIPGQLSERRMSHLCDTFFRELATGLRPDVAYGLQLRYPAAALFPELRQLAAPASLDTPPLDLGVEDHGTSAPLSVRMTGAALGMLGDLLAIELMLARDVLAAAPTGPVLGAGTGAALRMVEQAIATADPRPEAVHCALRDRFPAPPAVGHAQTPRD
jgi:histidine ammonia-lyase